ncbi:hypothetical protein K438DRAFT_1748430 [Mycena galopus ATCC 62051]|nr:hypothetical protein K438DRAFT_1748430 [Mycena galopus ATCC 62051]
MSTSESVRTLEKRPRMRTGSTENRLHAHCCIQNSPRKARPLFFPHDAATPQAQPAPTPMPLFARDIRPRRIELPRTHTRSANAPTTEDAPGSLISGRTRALRISPQTNEGMSEGSPSICWYPQDLVERYSDVFTSAPSSRPRSCEVPSAHDQAWGCPPHVPDSRSSLSGLRYHAGPGASARLSGRNRGLAPGRLESGGRGRQSERSGVMAESIELPRSADDGCLRRRCARSMSRRRGAAHPLPPTCARGHIFPETDGINEAKRRSDWSAESKWDILGTMAILAQAWSVQVFFGLLQRSGISPGKRWNVVCGGGRKATSKVACLWRLCFPFRPARSGRDGDAHGEGVLRIQNCSGRQFVPSSMRRIRRRPRLRGQRERRGALGAGYTARGQGRGRARRGGWKGYGAIDGGGTGSRGATSGSAVGSVRMTAYGRDDRRIGVDVRSGRRRVGVGGNGPFAASSVLDRTSNTSSRHQSFRTVRSANAVVGAKRAVAATGGMGREDAEGYEAAES